MRRPLWVTGSVLMALGLALAAGSGSQAQEIPDEFHNLKVLDPEISKDELKETMTGFTDQLGVKCTFCHVLGEYPKDDLEHKRIARLMIRLVKDMREGRAMYFKEGTEDSKIDCWTCHRGEAEIEGRSKDDDDWI